MSYAVKQINNFMAVQLVSSDKVNEIRQAGYFVFNSRESMLEAYEVWQELLF